MTTLSLLGYHLTFDAEMGSPSDMSEFRNTFENGNTTLYNNHEAENYAPYDTGDTANPYDFQDGALVINATPTPRGGLPYTSGMLETSGIFSQNQGYFEIRAETPSAQGFWPAFWMLPVGEGYPEIDIMEQPNNSGTSTEYWTHTSTPTDSSGGFTDTGVNVSQGYHTYGFLWTADTIQYVFDGNLVGYSHVTPPALDGIKMYLLANLAVGGAGSWPGTPPDDAASTYSIDYIRAFSNNPADPTVSQEAISSPDGLDTTPLLVPQAPPDPSPIGKGPDALVLKIAEDAYQGDAQFTISIDGVQQGGIQTATASNAEGVTQNFTVLGKFGHASHVVTVNFLNNYGGAPGADRNLFVNGASINGAAIGNAVLREYSDGPQSFDFRANVPPALTIGSGADTVLFTIAEDASGGNARFILYVDGVQQGSVENATALRIDGQTQTVAVEGNFGAGPHTETVRFTNGAAAGASSNGRDLYIDRVSYDGIAVAGAASELSNKGNITFNTAAPSLDTLTLNLTEDAWQGDAQAQISIDGVTLGAPAISFLNANGISQQITYTGYFGGAGAAHTIGVDFLNDAYAGPGEDRNLYVQSIIFDNTAITGETTIDRSGLVDFSAPATMQAPSVPGVHGPSLQADHDPAGPWFLHFALQAN